MSGLISRMSTYDLQFSSYGHKNAPTAHWKQTVMRVWPHNFTLYLTSSSNTENRQSHSRVVIQYVGCLYTTYSFLCHERMYGHNVASKKVAMHVWIYNSPRKYM